MKALMLLLPLLLGPTVPTPQAGGVQLSIEHIDGDDWCTLRAEGEPLDQLLHRLADELEVELEGLEGARRPVLVTVDLVRRPVDQVLEIVCGTAGMTHSMRAGVLAVRPDDLHTLTSEELFDRAATSYLKAATRYPDHSFAPACRLDQGRVAEARGLPGAALDHYSTVVERYPMASAVPDALQAAGRLLEGQGRWAEANQRYRDLANHPAAETYHAVARLGVARCTIELGDPETAHHLLSALEIDRPARTPEERAERDLTRAHALVGMGRHDEGLRVLDGVEASFDPGQRTRSLRIRAQALHGTGLLADAAGTWLAYGRAVALDNPSERTVALHQSARLSLEAGDEVATLFVCREADSLGLTLEFDEYRRRAYERLGFETVPAVATNDAETRIAAAEENIAQGEYGRAADALDDLMEARRALDPDLHVRLAVSWAQCLDYTEGVDRAALWLREVRSSFTAPADFERRARLDITAAELFEKHELLDRAIEAYRGRY